MNEEHVPASFGWRSSRLGYRPALDGVRALAILAVLAVHGAPLTGGFFGVDIFFVLSGFLITSLLLEEWMREGRVARRAFYSRRARRLLPALILTIGGVGAIYAVLPGLGRGIGFPRSALAALFYYANWAQAFRTHSSAPSLGLLSHTWSLAIEEQFYIGWPLLLLFLLRRGLQPGLLAGFLVGLAGLSTTFCYLTWTRGLGGSAYYESHTRAVGLLTGCLLATLWASGKGHALISRAAAPLVVAGAAFAALGVAFVTLSTQDSLVYSAGFPIVALSSAALIAHLLVSPVSVITRIFEARPAVWLGARSYGVYLYHLPIFYLLTKDRLGHPRFAILFPIRVLATLAVAAASYRVVESRFLRRNRDLSPASSSDGQDANTLANRMRWASIFQRARR
jgi:peptidoglycan/LPS O-acetylase OafA/YrhL